MSKEDGRALAEQLIAGIEAEGSFVEEGQFRIDLAKAREKLANFRIAEPLRFVLLLVEVANLLPECRSIAFEFSARRTRVVLDEVYLEGHEVKGCFDLLFAEAASTDPRMGARELLGAALNAALRTTQGTTTLTAFGPQTHRLEFSPGSSPQFMTVSKEPVAPRLVLELDDPRGARSPREQLRRQLFRDARHGQRPVFIDGDKLAQGLDGAELVDAVELRGAGGESAGFVGWSPHNRGQPEGLIVLVANGVALAATLLPGLPRGMVAFVHADHLARDLSRTRLIRDARFESLAQLALAGAKGVRRPAPVLLGSDHDLRSRNQLIRSVLAGSAMFTASIVAGPLGAALGLAAASATMIGAPVLQSSRAAHVQRYGWLAAGEVEELKVMRLMSVEGETVFRADVKVDRGGPDILYGQLYTDRPLKVGARIFVRTHPKYPELFTPANPRPSRMYKTR